MNETNYLASVHCWLWRPNNGCLESAKLDCLATRLVDLWALALLKHVLMECCQYSGARRDVAAVARTLRCGLHRGTGVPSVSARLHIVINASGLCHMGH
jgi:hypothetical protein